MDDGEEWSGEEEGSPAGSPGEIPDLAHIYIYIYIYILDVCVYIYIYIYIDVYK